MSWKNEKARHSLASRGINTKLEIPYNGYIYPGPDTPKNVYSGKKAGEPWSNKKNELFNTNWATWIFGPILDNKQWEENYKIRYEHEFHPGASKHWLEPKTMISKMFNSEQEAYDDFINMVGHTPGKNSYIRTIECQKGAFWWSSPPIKYDKYFWEYTPVGGEPYPHELRKSELKRITKQILKNQ